MLPITCPYLRHQVFLNLAFFLSFASALVYSTPNQQLGQASGWAGGLLPTGSAVTVHKCDCAAACDCAQV